MRAIAGAQEFSLIIDENSTVWKFGTFFLQQNQIQIPAQTPIQSVSCGTSHAMMLDTEGSVWGLGSNDNCKLGLPLHEGKIHNIPTQLPNLPEIQAISCSAYAQSLLLDVNGTVWGCGSSSFGQLGSKSGAQNMARIEGLPRIEAIAAGFYHSLLLDERGSVWALGYNGNGEIGVGNSFSDISTPQKLEVLPTIHSISTSYVHSMFLDTNGVIWGCGRNSGGELGIPIGTGNSIFTPEKTLNIPAVQSVATGFYHTCFLDYEGEVWCCGKWDGKANLPQKLPTEQPIHTIYAGPTSAYLQGEEGLWVCGSNEQGKLGVESKDVVKSPTLVPSLKVMDTRRRYTTKSARNVVQ